MDKPDSAPSLAQRVRLFVFEYFVEHAAPPVVEQVMTQFGVDRATAVDIFRELAEARHIALVKGTARILMAFPLSAIATPFRVVANGKIYFANCAWDAIAFHSMLKVPIRIDSFCHHCAQPITIEMSDGHASRVEPKEAIVHLALPPAQWWEDITTTCSNTMVFFASLEHRDTSGIATALDQTASLTPDETYSLGIPLYADKLAIDYTRPSRDELNAHFASLGLTGPYWQL
jgi:hypothetical protein